MSIQCRFAVTMAGLCFGLLVARPESIMAGVGFICSIALFAFLQYIERAKIDEIASLKDEFKDFEIKMNQFMALRGGR